MDDCTEPDGTTKGSCAEALEDLGRYLDGEMDAARIEEIRTHLGHCFPCADRASFEEQLKAIVRRECAEQAPDGLITRIRARLDASATSG